MKAFNLPIEYVLHEMSYSNLILYGASLPTYRSHGDREGGEDIDASDPGNADKVRAFIKSSE
ncbi:MAG TPA: hypothetical protein DC009_08920 [Porphyromonadaceae bacterium]|nr:hypothetical protein [Porphyromonadaceae bacterium]